MDDAGPRASRACSTQPSPRPIRRRSCRCIFPLRQRGRTIVVGAGKASAAMARAFEHAWNGQLSGLVVTRYGHAAPTERIEIVEASHPVPDAKGEQAARRMLEIVRGLTEEDLVVALISGGGSALLARRPRGLSARGQAGVNRALLASAPRSRR